MKGKFYPLLVLTILSPLFFYCAKQDSLTKMEYKPFLLQLTTDEATNVLLITSMIDQAGLRGKEREAALAHYLQLAKVPVKPSRQ